MSARLIDSLATTGPLIEVFSDLSVLQALLDFEAGLARAEARLGVIPKEAGDAIAKAARAELFDSAKLAEATLRAGTLGIPIAKALTEAVRHKNPRAAGFVHWGATSQDVADTALVLLLKASRPMVLKDLRRSEKALSRLSEEHKNTVMLGRTLLQSAPPITLGLKAAGWLGAIRRGRRRLERAFEDALVLQFGGASGTLSSLGNDGPAVAKALAQELQLNLPDAPWHTHRDRLASVICACGVLTGSLSKMARDVSLLMQNEVAEAAEPGSEGRGGSSTMPHKRNPIACSLALAAGQRVPGLVASYLSAMVQEHERGLGGWQAEWPILASALQATGVAAESMAEVAEGISVDEKRMRRNIEGTNGAVFAERATMLLGKRSGRDRAHKLLEEAVQASDRKGKRLVEVLKHMPDVSSQLDSTELRHLEDPIACLGSAEIFRKALVSGTSMDSRRSSRKPSRRRKKEH